MDDDEAERAVPDADELDAAVTAAAEPYADLDVSALPDWWREAIEEFEAHDLRPYQPPRFADGALAFAVVERLEAGLGVDIDFFGRDVRHGDDWAVRIDGDPVGTIGHRRASDGYTVYEMESDAFAEWIAERA